VRGKISLHNERHSVDEITVSLLFFDNVEDAMEYAPLPRKKDELMRFV